MSEFACRKHGYHDETETHSCPDCYADWLAAKPKAPPYKGCSEIFGTPDVDGWYEWSGDDMIRPAGMVEVSWIAGGTYVTNANALAWGKDCGIAKWRPAQ